MGKMHRFYGVFSNFHQSTNRRTMSHFTHCIPGKSGYDRNNLEYGRMTAMNHRYAHILSPIKVGNLVLKNRLINSKCIPEGIQGPQTWPTE